MDIFAQLASARQLRETSDELERTALKEGGAALRDFLLKELAEEIQSPSGLAPSALSRPLQFPLVTGWKAVKKMSIP